MTDDDLHSEVDATLQWLRAVNGDVIALFDRWEELARREPPQDQGLRSEALESALAEFAGINLQLKIVATQVINLLDAINEAMTLGNRMDKPALLEESRALLADATEIVVEASICLDRIESLPN